MNKEWVQFSKHYTLCMLCSSMTLNDEAVLQFKVS